MAPSAVAPVEQEAVMRDKKTAATNGAQGDKKTKTPLEMISQGVSLPGIPMFPTYAKHRQWMLEKMALAFRVFARKGQSTNQAHYFALNSMCSLMTRLHRRDVRPHLPPGPREHPHILDESSWQTFWTVEGERHDSG